MKYWKALIYFLAAFLIQSSLLNMINIAGHTPNLLLALAVVFSFLYSDKTYGVLYGGIFGVLYDICFNTVVGPTPIAIIAVAVIILLIRENFNPESIISMIVISVMSLVIYFVIFWGLNSIGGLHTALGIAAVRYIWTALYSFAVMMVLYIILRRKIVKARTNRYYV